MTTDRITIRPELNAEFAEIRTFVKTAFETAKVSNGDEQNFVDRLRASPDHLPDLALVAIEDDAVVGHVMATRTTIATATGAREILLLAPLAVELTHRDAGLGARLTREVLERGRAAGFDAVTLVGDPAYYGRFGFRPATDFGVENTNGIPPQYVLMCELAPGALAGISGTITYAT
jgi:putative acetyltransferase